MPIRATKVTRRLRASPQARRHIASDGPQGAAVGLVELSFPGLLPVLSCELLVFLFAEIVVVDNRGGVDCAWPVVTNPFFDAYLWTPAT